MEVSGNGTSVAGVRPGVGEAYFGRFGALAAHELPIPVMLVGGMRTMVERGKGQEILPFALLGWIECVADTAADWLFSDELDNVHVEPDADFSQVAGIGHEGALLIGTYDTFTYGDPAGFLTNINDHFPHHEHNKLVFIEGTGHTYQQKEQAMADDVLELVQTWDAEGWKRGE